MAIANRIEETSATTGTGSITLTGAVDSDHETFASRYASLIPFPYLIEHETDFTREMGMGYLSAGLLVRDSVTDNSSGTTAKISFASGGLRVLSVTIDKFLDDLPNFSFLNDSGLGIPMLRADNYSFSDMTTEVLVADRLLGGRFRTSSGLKVNQARIECTASVASTEVKLALYRLNNDGKAEERIASCRTNAFDTSVTGLLVATLDEGEIYIGPGDYLLTIVSDGAPTVRAINPAEYMTGHFGGSASTSLLIQRGLFSASHTFSTALPEPLGVTWSASSSSDHPAAIFTHS